MAEPTAETPARASRVGRGKSDAAAAGLPNFCRPRHYVKGANVFVVPLWDFTSRWLPEELRRSQASASDSRPQAEAAPPTGTTTPEAEATASADRTSDEGHQKLADAEAADSDGDASAPSESDHSEIAWEGPLGGESRHWSRAEVDSALMLLRRVTSGSSTYGLAVSAALFAPGLLAESSDAALDRRLVSVLSTREPCWAVVALRSGHFAGAVFRGPEPLCHKAVHRYTVRAKAGGSQSAMDNTGKKPKSAGSNLRRYGEQRLAEEIREFMTEKWAKELGMCDLIFVSVSKRMRATLLGTERNPYVPFSKVRKLPFMVGRPTFEAVKDAYVKVASAVFADEQTAETLVAKFRPAAAAPPADPVPVPVPQTTAKVEKDPEPAPAPKYDEAQDELFTPLHAAASAGDEDRIIELLDAGADPRARDGKDRVAYYLCSGPRAREAFRRWRGRNEDAWDWDAAQVPEGLTEELEQRKREKEREKKKKQKEKQKENKAKAKSEEEERQRKEEEEAAILAAAQTKCDFCKKGIVGKPFSRLSFYYCSTECVNNHRRELQVEAAMKRLG